MGFFEETLSLAVGVLPSLYSSFLLLPSEQVLLEPTVEAIPTSLAKPEAVAMIAQVLLADLTLERVPH